jgi:RHS repeat-associated protein
VNDANYNVVAIVQVSDGVASVVERYVYDPFGTQTVLSGDFEVEGGSSFNWVYGFQGGKLDTVTDDTTFGARNLDSGTGTWTSQDPITFAAGDDDLYRFEGNRPIDSLDPSGLAAISYPFSTAISGWISQLANGNKLPNLNFSSVAAFEASFAAALKDITNMSKNLLLYAGLNWISKQNITLFISLSGDKKNGKSCHCGDPKDVKVKLVGNSSGHIDFGQIIPIGEFKIAKLGWDVTAEPINWSEVPGSDPQSVQGYVSVTVKVEAGPFSATSTKIFGVFRLTCGKNNAGAQLDINGDPVGDPALSVPASVDGLPVIGPGTGAIQGVTPVGTAKP